MGDQMQECGWRRSGYLAMPRSKMESQGTEKMRCVKVYRMFWDCLSQDFCMRVLGNVTRHSCSGSSWQASNCLYRIRQTDPISLYLHTDNVRRLIGWQRPILHLLVLPSFAFEKMLQTSFKGEFEPDTRPRGYQRKLFMHHQFIKFAKWFEFPDFDIDNDHILIVNSDYMKVFRTGKDREETVWHRPETAASLSSHVL